MITQIYNSAGKDDLRLFLAVMTVLMSPQSHDHGLYTWQPAIAVS